MKKLIFMLLLAAFSLSTFAMVPPQQDTTKKAQKQKMKTKSKSTKTKDGKWKKAKTDTARKDTIMHPSI